MNFWQRDSLCTASHLTLQNCTPQRGHECGPFWLHETRSVSARPWSEWVRTHRRSKTRTAAVSRPAQLSRGRWVPAHSAGTRRSAGTVSHRIDSTANRAISLTSWSSTLLKLLYRTRRRFGPSWDLRIFRRFVGRFENTSDTFINIKINWQNIFSDHVSKYRHAVNFKNIFLNNYFYLPPSSSSLSSTSASFVPVVSDRQQHGSSRIIACYELSKNRLVDLLALLFALHVLEVRLDPLAPVLSSIRQLVQLA
jgi:hypothetical protein